MEAITEKSFEQVLFSTVHMIRASWDVPICLFIQTDDSGVLRIRASDGLARKPPASLEIPMADGIVAQSMKNNSILESGKIPWDEGLAEWLKPALTAKAKTYAIVPVAGQSRALGVLVLGPVEESRNLLARETELRSAGNLCAVLSAYWRLYDWMNHFLPQINHELRTPLTAIQGSLGMVLGGVFGNVGAEVKTMLEMAHKGCERTVSAIEEYINAQNPRKKP